MPASPLTPPVGVEDQLIPGTFHVLANEAALTTGVKSILALPNAARAPEGYTISWGTEYQGGDPAAVNIVLEICFGVAGGGPEIWFVLDTTTVVTGEFRKVLNVKAPFMRLRVVSVTTGNDFTVFIGI